MLYYSVLPHTVHSTPLLSYIITSYPLSSCPILSLSHLTRIILPPTSHTVIVCHRLTCQHRITFLVPPNDYKQSQFICDLNDIVELDLRFQMRLLPSLSLSVDRESSLKSILMDVCFGPPEREPAAAAAVSVYCCYYYY